MDTPHTTTTRTSQSGPPGPLPTVGDTVVPAVPSLALKIAGIRFAHPVLAAPGPLEFGREVQSAIDLRAFAGMIVKSITLEPRTGNPHPQLARTEAGWLNSMGLPNRGLAGFITRDLPFLRTLGIPLIVSIAGEQVDEFATMVEWLTREEGIAAIELNISCPNIDDGLVFGTDPGLTARLVGMLRPLTHLPLIVKLTPNVTDVVPIARAAQDAGADALSMINTLTGMAIDVATRRPRLGAVTGGLSGPALRPVAVRMVWEVARACRLPIIGMGGIETAEDALEFIIAGARAVAVGTAVLERATAATEIREGLARFLTEQGIGDINALVGTLRIP